MLVRLSDGEFINLDDFNHLLGYQIKNKITGRILPACQPYEVFTKESANERLIQVCEFYQKSHDISINWEEYILEPIYKLDQSDTNFVLRDSKSKMF